MEPEHNWRFPSVERADHVAEALSLCEVSEMTCSGAAIRFLTAPTLFPPDLWTQALLTGFSNHFGVGKDLGVVVEIGVGPGTIPLCLCLAMGHSMRTYIGIDINPLACQIARLNLSLTCPKLPSSIIMANVCGPVENLWDGNVDVILANVPQMPAPDAENLDPNNYYSLDVVDAGLAKTLPLTAQPYGLGLIANVLRVASVRLRPHSGVAFVTLSERCGAEPIYQLFHSTGLKWETIYTVRVPQADDTIVDPLVDAELTFGNQAKFFANMDDGSAISANEAARRVREGHHVFHDLHVVLARRV